MNIAIRAFGLQPMEDRDLCVNLVAMANKTGCPVVFSIFSGPEVVAEPGNDAGELFDDLADARQSGVNRRVSAGKGRA